MNGDGAGNLQAFGVTDSGTGGHGSVTSDTASKQQLALLQLQLKIAEAETEKQRLMLESQRLRARNGAESNESDDSVPLGGRSEEDRRLKFASLLKGVLAPMPNQEALAPMWFEDVEATLESYEVLSEWWAGLVWPQLSERARGLLCRLTAHERKAYVKLKSSILEGLRLSVAEYKMLFAGSKKGERESWDQFAVRLENNFDYYVQSSKNKLLDGTDALITPNDYAQLLEETLKRDIVSDECSAVEETEAIVELSDEACEEQRAMQAS
ncbi:hypothetical protein HPB51_027568 [Rhipicephalus microplus]|uniref:Uncharacterized protein n=1 Tax=Rhipicephalus microplus TaxID=6941 RepID=A0A9J6CZU6_RHIMP|nr:hypothetical protein HPB51_027568 [Rhipicephalus microplus]